MNTCTLRRLLWVVTLLLLVFEETANAAVRDEDLIKEQITIKLDSAGMLNRYQLQKNLFTNLKIIGEINGTDIRYLREISGGRDDIFGQNYDGNLSVLDLSEARIVKGGKPYLQYPNRNDSYTRNDTVSSDFFCNCHRLER